MNLEEISTTFTIFLVAIIAFFFIGNFTFNVFNKSNGMLLSSILDIGIKTLIGATLVSALIGIIKTDAISIQTLVLPLTIMFAYSYADSEKKITSTYTKNIYLKIGIVVVGIFTFHYFLFLHLDDHIFYSKLGKSVYELGIESISSLYSNYLTTSGISLYHFSDLWLSEFLSQVAIKNSLLSMTKIVYPIYHVITYLIIMGILFENKINNTLIYTTAIIYGTAFLVAPILTSQQGHNTYWHYSMPHVTSFKSISIYPHIILALYYLKKTDIINFALLITLACIQYFALAVPLVPTVNLVLLGFLIIKKTEKKEIIKSLVVFNGFIILMILFSLLFKDSVKTFSSFGNIKHAIYPIKFYVDNWYDYLSFFVTRFSLIFLLFPITTLLLLVNIKKSSITLLFTLIAFTIALIFYTILKDLTNSVQAISIITGPIMIYLTIENIISIKNLKLKNIVLLTLTILAISNLISISSLNNGSLKRNKFDQKLYEFSSKYLNNTNWIYYSEKPYSTWMYNSHILNSPIFHNNNTNLPIDVSPFFQENFELYKKKNNDAPTCKIKHNLKALSYFLRKKKVKYVFIENKNKCNHLFLKMTTPVIVQKNSGIYKLKYEI